MRAQGRHCMTEKKKIKLAVPTDALIHFHIENRESRVLQQTAENIKLEILIQFR